MQHEVDVNGRIRQVAVHRADEGFAVSVDGRAWRVLAAQVDLHTLSLLIADAGRESFSTGGPTKTTPDPVKPDAATDTTAGGRESFSTGAARKTTPDPQTVLSYEVTLVPAPGSAQLVVDVAGPAVSLERRTTRVLVTLNGRRSRGSGNERAQPGSGPQRIVSPMAGKIVRVLVKSGEAVRAGQPLVVVEAMKMENELRALRDGTVAEIHAREGTSVDAGVLLMVVG